MEAQKLAVKWFVQPYDHTTEIVSSIWLIHVTHTTDIGSPRGLCEVKVYVLLHALTSEIRQTASIQNNKLTSAYMQICTYTKKCAIYITCE